MNYNLKPNRRHDSWFVLRPTNMESHSLLPKPNINGSPTSRDVCLTKTKGNTFFKVTVAGFYFKKSIVADHHMISPPFRRNRNATTSGMILFIVPRRLAAGAVFLAPPPRQGTKWSASILEDFIFLTFDLGSGGFEPSASRAGQAALVQCP